LAAGSDVTLRSGCISVDDRFQASRLVANKYQRSPDRCGHMCYDAFVGDSISVRDLRNTVSEVLRRVEGGERLTVTVDRRPVAEIVPLRRRRAVPAAEALALVSRHAADRGLFDDVRGLLSDTTDDL